MTMEVVFLGTTAAVPSVERGHTANAIKYRDEVILWDCGEGTQRHLIKSKLSYMKIKKLFVTHFHGDHFLGMPGLIQTMSFAGREEPLFVYGPPGIEELLKHVLALGEYTLKFDVIAQDLDDNTVIDDEFYTIRAVPVQHHSKAFGLIFEEKKGREFIPKKAEALGLKPGPLYSKLQRGESVVFEGKTIMPDDVLGQKKKGHKIVYSSDTRPCDTIVKACKDALLIHDGTFETSLKENALETRHSTCAEAAKVAKDGGAESLYLTHISPRYKDTGALIDEAKKIFPNSYIATDFLRVKID